MALHDPKYRYPGMVLMAGLLIALAGCATTISLLDEAKALHTEQKYDQLSQLQVACKADDEGCNQVRLLKGDACFRIMKTTADRQTQRAALDCAVAELSAGIDMTKAWGTVPVSRAQIFENACEAERLRADVGERDRYEAMLATHADRFMGFAPDHPGAVYYQARAEFYALTRAPNPCNGLQALHARIDSALQRFQTDSRYLAAFQALKGTVAAEQQMRCPN